jgi:DNA-binding phage protein
MKTVKDLTSRDYQDYILSTLSNSERAANNLEIVLQDKERSSALLRLTLNDIISAKIKNNTLTDEAKLYFEKMEQMLAETKGEELFTFIDLLSALGFKLSINI